MAGGIFLVQDKGQLVELSEQAYEAEEVLQRLIAEHPNILAGEQMNPNAPRRWLLIAREAAIPGEEGSTGRWALDHLFLDQDAVPTLVEVKRSSDTRTRREVVGQMLDYASNAVVYWPADNISALYERTCIASGRSAEEVLATFLGPGMDAAGFWQAAKQNMQAQRIRLVFVADIIPPELRRIVEFLNGQMNPAEVIAVEVRQYVGNDVRALVPQVVGQTAAAQQAKASVRTTGKRKWDESSFMAALTSRRGKDEASVARKILDWATRTGLRIWWGEGQQDGSFYPMVDRNGSTDWTISVWTYGRVETSFQQLAREGHPFTSDARRLELLDRLNQISGVDIPATSIAKRPTFPIAVLLNEEAFSRFLNVLDWLVGELRSAAAQNAAAET